MLSRAQNTFHHNPRLRGPVSSKLYLEYVVMIHFSDQGPKVQCLLKVKEDLS